MTDTTLTLAFYKGDGTLFDRLVRFATRSPYSHVELIADAPAEPHKQSFIATSISASLRDGGVRQKEIAFNPARWDFITLPDWPVVSSDDIWAAAKARLGYRYDVAGILFTFAVPLRRQSSGRYFCSELIAAALLLPEPHTLAPGDLYRWTWKVSDAHAEGRAADKPCCKAAFDKAIQAADEWYRNIGHGNPADEVRIALHEACTACPPCASTAEARVEARQMKPLEWSGRGAFCDFGAWQIVTDDDGDFGYCFSGSPNITFWHWKTEAEAKVAAEEDRKSRILSALIPEAHGEGQSGE